MRWIEGYALGASLLTLAATAYVFRLLSAPGPQRGFGGGQAAMVGAAVILVALLHGSVVSGVALAKGRTPAAWTAATIHALVILAGILRALLR